jgi:menaquinone-dependent protoporphyrinogen IX oxidase
MKGIVMYKGKYGATREYAGFIGEALKWPVYTPEQLLEPTLDAADVLVIGSSVYAGQLLLNGWLKKHVAQLQHKKVYLFIVCATPADKKDVLEQIAKQNIPAELREHVFVYFLRGRVVIEKLNWIDKLMLKFAARVTKDPGEKQRMIHGFDAVSRDNALPLINAVKAAMKISDLVIL